MMPQKHIKVCYAKKSAIKPKKLIRLYEFIFVVPQALQRPQFKPDDHSKLVPLLPIPNRTVKRLRADDSAGSRVKVGHRQAIYSSIPLWPLSVRGVLLFGEDATCRNFNRAP
jgi:hypothetical protein